MLINIFLLFFSSAFAQYGTKKECLYFDYVDTVTLDSVIIVPSSLRIFSGNITVRNYDFIFYKNKVILDTPIENVKICYTSISFPQSLKHKDTNIIVPVLKKGLNEISYEEKNNVQSSQKKDLNASGVLKRGISAGNNTDIVMNSLLDLTLEGKLTEDLAIKAKIKDNDTPIQPDGTTTTLRDFGEVFLNVYDSLNSFSAGDIEITNSFGYNLKINKSVKGVFYEFADSSFFMKAGTCVTKGVFRRQEFMGSEGNQGPYKLNGKNGEVFVLIVAGTERVFVDGKSKTRGSNKDYTIDYNAAEITFTENCPINANSRIIVEFQYTRRFYPRFFTEAEVMTKKKNLVTYFGYYSQNDAKNQSLYPLTDDMKFFLANLGDSVAGTYYPSFDTTSFDKNKILYFRKDTVVQDKLYEIFVYSDTVNQTQTLYNVGFVYAGEGNGDYVLDATKINGIVYKWVAPINGKHRGSYMPGTALYAPAKKNIALAGTNLKINNIDFKIETYFSKYDLNTFSPLDDGDNNSFSEYIQLKKKKGIFNFDLNYSFLKQNFAVFEPFRTPEFSRDWNLNGVPDNDEHFFHSLLKFISDTNKNLTFENDFLKRGSFYGFRNFANIFYTKKYWGTRTELSLLRTFDKANSSTFVRTNTQNFIRFFNFETGMIFRAEDNRFFEADTLGIRSFAFRSLGFYLQNIDTQFVSCFFSYEKRLDFLPERVFLPATVSDDYNFKFKKSSSKYWNALLTLVYRRMKIIDTTITSAEPQNTLLFRSTYSFVLKGLKFNMLLSHGGGLERKRKYLFVEVPPTKGNYAWIDYNQNGIKEQNEFEPAKFPDMARFVKISYQTDEYVKVYSYALRQNLLLSPAGFCSTNHKFYKFWKAFDFSSSLNIEKKLYNNNFFSDSGVVYYRFVNFNNQKIRLIKKISLIFSQSISSNISTLINGNEKNFSQEFAVDLVFDSYFFDKFILGLKKGNKRNFSEYFLDKNYGYSIFASEFTSFFRFGKITVRNKGNYFFKQAETGEQLVSWGSLSSVGIVGNIDLNFQIEYIKNIFDGTTDTPLAYSMLEGLQPGNNVVFSIITGKKIFGNVNSQLSVQGRFIDNRLIFNGIFNFSILF